MPATSPGFESMTSALKPRAAAHFRYMRSSICAQSWASVPPAPAWMSRKALWESISPRNMRLNSSARTLGLEFRALALEVARRGLVVLGFGQFEQLERGPYRIARPVHLGELGAQARALAAELLGPLGLVPDRRVFELAAHLFEALLLAVVLKETPSRRPRAPRGPCNDRLSWVTSIGPIRIGGAAMVARGVGRAQDGSRCSTTSCSRRSPWYSLVPSRYTQPYACR